MTLSRHRLARAVRVLHGGGLLAHPTEGVWGLACDPLQPRAVMRLLAAKRRDPDKGLILIASHVEAFLPYLAPDIEDALQSAQATWPGPTTWLLPASPELPWWLGGAHETLAVRVTAHPLAALLCEAFGGALVSSSANVSGHPAAQSALQVRRQIGEWVDILLQGELQTPGQPSTIRDAASGQTLRGG